MFLNGNHTFLLQITNVHHNHRENVTLTWLHEYRNFGTTAIRLFPQLIVSLSIPFPCQLHLLTWSTEKLSIYFRYNVVVTPMLWDKTLTKHKISCNHLVLNWDVSSSEFKRRHSNSRSRGSRDNTGQNTQNITQSRDISAEIAIIK